MHNFLKPFLFCFAAAFGLSLEVLAGANNQAPKVESENNSSVATELYKLKESSALSPEERARIRRALAAYAKSSGKESSLIEEKQTALHSYMGLLTQRRRPQMVRVSQKKLS